MAANHFANVGLDNFAQNGDLSVEQINAEIWAAHGIAPGVAEQVRDPATGKLVQVKMTFPASVAPQVCAIINANPGVPRCAATCAEAASHSKLNATTGLVPAAGGPGSANWGLDLEAGFANYLAAGGDNNPAKETSVTNEFQVWAMGYPENASRPTYFGGVGKENYGNWEEQYEGFLGSELLTPGAYVDYSNPAADPDFLGVAFSAFNAKAHTVPNGNPSVLRAEFNAGDYFDINFLDGRSLRCTFQVGLDWYWSDVGNGITPIMWAYVDKDGQMIVVSATDGGSGAVGGGKIYLKNGTYIYNTNSDHIATPLLDELDYAPACERGIVL